MDLRELTDFLESKGLVLRHVRFPDGFELTVDSVPNVVAEEAPAKASAPDDGVPDGDALERFVNRKRVQ